MRFKFVQESKTVKDSGSSSIIIMTLSSRNISTSLLIIETLRSTVSAYGNGLGDMVPASIFDNVEDHVLPNVVYWHCHATPNSLAFSSG